MKWQKKTLSYIFLDISIDEVHIIWSNKQKFIIYIYFLPVHDISQVFYYLLFYHVYLFLGPISCFHAHFRYRGRIYSTKRWSCTLSSLPYASTIWQTTGKVIIYKSCVEIFLWNMIWAGFGQLSILAIFNFSNFDNFQFWQFNNLEP